jgi:hypothetical protein
MVEIQDNYFFKLNFNFNKNLYNFLLREEFFFFFCPRKFLLLEGILAWVPLLGQVLMKSLSHISLPKEEGDKIIILTEILN